MVPISSEADVGDIAVEIEPSQQFHFLGVQQIKAEGQSDKLMSDLEVCKKCVSLNSSS